MSLKVTFEKLTCVTLDIPQTRIIIIIFLYVDYFHKLSE